MGIDANAVSPLWYSKGDLHSRESVSRGEMIEEWVIGSEMNVLNEPSECYTFAGVHGQSDIDVTLANDEWARCEFEWDVKNE